MAVAVQQSSAANLLALLDEEDDALKLYALQSLNKVVHEFWFQIASAIASVEAFYEDEGFSHRELAALVASKVRTDWRCLRCFALFQQLHSSFKRVLDEPGCLVASPAGVPPPG